MLGPSRPYSRACSSGDRQVFDRYGVLLADVDKALAGADGVGADDQPLENAVRIALEQAPVHVGAGVAFIGVDDHILDVARGVPASSATCAGGEAAAASAPQSGRLDLVEHLLGRHLEQRLGQRRIAAADDVAVDALGVDEAVQAKDEGGLVLVEGDLVLMEDPPAVVVLVEQPVDDLVLQDRLGDDLGDVVRFDLKVGHPERQDGDDRASFAEAVTAGPQDVHAAVEPLPLELVYDSLVHLVAAQGMAAGAGADGDTRLVRQP